MSSHSAALILVAAGPGTRLGAGRPKALVDLAGKPLLLHALESAERTAADAASPLFTEAVVVAPADHLDSVEDLLRHRPCPWSIKVVLGGSERQDSVLAGIDASTAEVVVIHDAARPFVSTDTMRRVIDAACRDGAAIAAVAAVDTVKIADDDLHITHTPQRNNVWLAQTPQAFHRDVLVQAHISASGTEIATDDAAMVEATGHPVRIVTGDPVTRKITTPEDLRWAEWMLASGQWPR